MSEPVRALNIFDYTDFRAYLAAYQEARKKADPKFSHRFIVKQIRAGSTGWFADLVKGRTNLSGTHMLGLIKLLALNQEEAQYFEILIRFDQAGSLEEKNMLFKRLVALKGIKPELVGESNFEYYSKWYHSVIRELLFIYEFDGDFAALGKKLQPPIGAAEARKSFRLLEKLGFIRKGANGKYSPLPGVLKKDPAFKSMHLSNFHQANAALAVESLAHFPKERRDISAMTLSFSEEGFQKAKEELKAMRSRLLAIADGEERPSKVYQCNFHMFPVTE